MSWFSGKPVEMYRFQRGAETWLVTTARRPVTVNSETYLPAYVERDNIRSSGDKGREKTTIMMDSTHPMIQPYAAGPPAAPTTVLILRAESDDGTFRFVWGGRIITADVGPAKAKINCEPISTTLRRLGLRRPYQVLCDLVLYDPNSCRATEVKVDATVTLIGGKTVSISVAGSPSEGLYAGGKIYFGTLLYFILEHHTSGGNTLVLAGPPAGLTVGAAIQISRGCPHDTIGCISFNNLDNYGGFPYMPQRNPFGLNPII